jgi:hypothetical protein
MVIDYQNAQRALTAQQVLAAAGIPARYTPDALIPISPDPAVTHWLVHRLEVPDRDGPRARAVLEAAGFWPGTAPEPPETGG